MKDFSKVANPITSLQRKSKRFVWDEKCAKGFDVLKEQLTLAPILKLPDPLKDFIVCTDACIEGLGGVLMREGIVVAYESRKLKDYEKNYATHYLELDTIVHALKMWRHYLPVRPFVLKIDHHSLQYLFTQPLLND